ncbi:MAG: hypothetical protein KME05_23935 [Gloeocapsa sp. UFS-A4-WI-NPMV-4B04]|nr:hypothetical protein [Gloeocapsa sp. UFS-A4-WI-NPMV-4B04]
MRSPLVPVSEPFGKPAQLQQYWGYLEYSSVVFVHQSVLKDALSSQ